MVCFRVFYCLLYLIQTLLHEQLFPRVFFCLVYISFISFSLTLYCYCACFFWCLVVALKSLFFSFLVFVQPFDKYLQTSNSCDLVADSLLLPHIIWEYSLWWVPRECLSFCVILCKFSSTLILFLRALWYFSRVFGSLSVH